VTAAGGLVRRLRRTVVLPALLAALVLAPLAPAGAVFHGTSASPGEYREAAFVFVEGDGGIVSTCGGTLVAPSKVLTAAHCVGAGDMYVALDLTDLAEIESGAAELHAVVATQVHPQWQGDIEYDVAVLTLAQPSAVPPVRVVGLDETALWDSGSTGTIVGWGATEDAPSSDQLREAEVVVDGSTCFGVTTVFCAGDGDPSACQGDSGGPLLADSGDELVLVGVLVAGTSGECGGGFFDIYARIGSEPLQGWLRDQIATPADTTAPRVTAATPTGSRVSRRTDLAVTFSEQVDPATVSRSTFRLLRLTADGPRRVTDVRVRPTTDGLGARLDPFGSSRTRMAGATRYRAVVTTGVRDLAGNQLDQDAATVGRQAKAWTFRTAR
jgi:trypsin